MKKRLDNFVCLTEKLWKIVYNEDNDTCLLIINSNIKGDSKQILQKGLNRTSHHV